MYRAFYGFNKIPFSKDIECKYMYMHENLKELEVRLDYMKKHRGLMLISGEPGTGKTSSLRKFVNSLNNESYLPIYIPLSTVAINDFYKQLNDKLKGERHINKSNLFKSIQERIIDFSVHKNKIPVIIIDEAHLLKNENFFELQIITNFKMDSTDPALFILISQCHLNDRLSRTILESFNQRIDMKYHFQPLSKSETKNYIIHNVTDCGADENIFNENAYKSIYNISGGVLRKIGKLALKALTYGSFQKKKVLTEDDVLTVSKEL